MSDRRYTLKEIDDMHAAMFGAWRARYGLEAPVAAMERSLQTYLIGGVEPQELIERMNALQEAADAKRRSRAHEFKKMERAMGRAAAIDAARADPSLLDPD